MPRKTNSTQSPARAAERKRRIEDVGEDAAWKKKRAANETRDEKRDAKRAREEKP